MTRRSQERVSSLRDGVQRLQTFAARVLFFVAGSLPSNVVLAFGAGIGRLLYWTSRWRVRVGMTNLRIAFPEWSEAQRRRVLAEAFANLGRVGAEIAQLESLSDDEILARTEVEGEEHLREALDRSQNGVIVVTAHLGNWELLGAAMAMRGYPLTVVYRRRDNPRLERLLRSWRTRPNFEPIPRGAAARGVLQALRARRVVALPVDQNVNRREGMFVPFFGRLASTRTGPARLAMRTGAPVLPAFIERVGKGPRHRIRVHPPLEIAPEAEALGRNLARINAALEDAIRAVPEQWTWTHRRWKTQPVGEPRPYRSRRAPGPLAEFFGGIGWRARRQVGSSSRR